MKGCSFCNSFLQKRAGLRACLLHVHLRGVWHLGYLILWLHLVT